MIRPVAERAPSPALPAAVGAAVGAWAGAWSITAPAPAIGLAAVCVLAWISRGRRAGIFAVVAAAAAGFASGTLGPGRMRRTGEAATAAIEPDRSIVARVRLEEEWIRSGDAWRARGELLRIAERGVDREAPAVAEVWLSGEMPPRAGRGDVVDIRGQISPAEIPVSTRDLPDPRPRVWVSCKSASLIERFESTFLSKMSAPARIALDRIETNPALSPASRATVEAVLFARTAELEEGNAETLARGGLLHWTSLSGLTTVVLISAFGIVLSLVGATGRVRDAVLLAGCAALPLALGVPPSALRACLVMAAFLTARLIERPISALQAVGLAALAVVLANPAQVLSAAFFLSFGSAAAVARLAAWRPSRWPFIPARIFSPLAAGLAAQLGALPVLLWRFNRLPLASWLVAPLAIPAIVLLCALSAGAVVASIVRFGTFPFDFGIRVVSAAIARVADRTGNASLLVRTPPLGAVLLLAALAAVSMLRGVPRVVRLATISAFAVIVAVLAVRGPDPVRPGDVSVEALDVGQGDAILVRAAGASCLVDGGGSFRADDEGFGRRHLLPKLLDRGIRSIDRVVLSHPHPDHALGLFSVVRELSVGEVVTGEGSDPGGYRSRLRRLAAEKRVPCRTARDGDRWKFGGGTIEVLRSGGRPTKVDRINNESVILKVEVGRRRLLLTGDAGAPAERELLDRPVGPGRFDLLKVGHHGSRTSTTAEFLAAIHPRAALISCGRRNHFGHPAPDTVERLARFRIPLFRTDRLSDVGIEFSPLRSRVFERGLP